MWEGQNTPGVTLGVEGGWRPLTVRFTGSGSEYLRIWLVNLLLTLVTLTLYWPFARARRLAYFQRNTLVDGDPLGFHADPWKMFRGYLLMLLLGVSYWAVSHFWPRWAGLPLVALALLWPALWCASLQFRLRNTSWRGVRLDFVGSMGGAYAVQLPLFLPAVLVLALPGAAVDESITPSPLLAGVFALLMLLWSAAFPWLMARVKRYQHGHYVYAQEQTRLDLGAGSLYLLSFKTWGLATLIVLGGVGLAMAVMPGGMGGPGRAGLAGLAGVAVAYLAFPLVLLPYVTVRWQNLLWSRTASGRLRFHSRLAFWAYFRINLVNWLLIVVTLGLFWPFAKVRAARARLEAIGLEALGDVDGWVAQARSQGAGVMGDAAGDFFGIDMGL